MQARYYDPVIGHFYSNDPVDAVEAINRGSPVLGFNRYAYAQNNPYKYTDPDGKLVGAFAFGAVVDDWGLTPLTDEERLLLFNLVEEREGNGCW